jgi:mRNA-degrading endonuclease toxin of MazEF toxin-antitoxin module
MTTKSRTAPFCIPLTHAKQEGLILCDQVHSRGQSQAGVQADGGVAQGDRVDAQHSYEKCIRTM